VPYLLECAARDVKLKYNGQPVGWMQSAIKIIKREGGEKPIITEKRVNLAISIEENLPTYLKDETDPTAIWQNCGIVKKDHLKGIRKIKNRPVNPHGKVGRKPPSPASIEQYEAELKNYNTQFDGATKFIEARLGIDLDQEQLELERASSSGGGTGDPRRLGGLESETSAMNPVQPRLPGVVDVVFDDSWMVCWILLGIALALVYALRRRLSRRAHVVQEDDSDSDDEDCVKDANAAVEEDSDDEDCVIDANAAAVEEDSDDCVINF